MSVKTPVARDTARSSRTPTAQIRVMVVDDSLTVRTILSKVVEKADDLSLVATASSAEQAIEKLRKITVDVILLDLEMPGMGGLAGLPEILELSGEAQVLVVSSLTKEGAEVTMTALSMGAADTLHKPQPGEFNADYRQHLVERIRALAPLSSEGAGKVAKPAVSLPETRRAPANATRCLAIGGSTGGIHSLCQFFVGLPSTFTPPIVITQHLPEYFVPIFANQVELAASRKTQVAQNGLPLVPGEIMIAPGDGHLTFAWQSGQLVAKITYDDVPSGCRPSVDPMFESLAQAVDGEMIGVVLSGMGRDGRLGAKTVVEKGGAMVAECPETCAVWGMPRGIAEDGLASQIASPEELAAWVGNRKTARL